MYASFPITYIIIKKPVQKLPCMTSNREFQVAMLHSNATTSSLQGSTKFSAARRRSIYCLERPPTKETKHASEECVQKAAA